MCAPLLQALLDGPLRDRAGRDRLLELLLVLSGLSPDPITVSCAMVHVAELAVAEQGGGDLSTIYTALPESVRSLLDELHKLRVYESEQSFTATERSAEGLRRLLLALVEDVRVVLIVLSWELVLLRQAKADSGWPALWARRPC